LAWADRDVLRVRIGVTRHVLVCEDRNGHVNWVIGTAAHSRHFAMEMDPRLAYVGSGDLADTFPVHGRRDEL